MKPGKAGSGLIFFSLQRHRPLPKKYIFLQAPSEEKPTSETFSKTIVNWFLSIYCENYLSDDFCFC